MSNEEFPELLARARQGDKDALAGVHLALEEKLRKAAHRRLGWVLRRYVDSMDIVQSAQKSLLICLRAGKYDISDEGKLTALAMRILQRKISRKWRKVRQDLKVQGRLAQEPPAAELNGAAPALENAELVQHLMKYMNKTEKELVRLRLQHHTLESAARVLGLDPGYARVFIGRMKERLGAMFELPEAFP
jgi:DNA-directed RNA polymerase specialized sigma24 family protein